MASLVLEYNKIVVEDIVSLWWASLSSEKHKSKQFWTIYAYVLIKSPQIDDVNNTNRPGHFGMMLDMTWVRFP
jgi:hypothetical protein